MLSSSCDLLSPSSTKSSSMSNSSYSYYNLLDPNSLISSNWFSEIIASPIFGVTTCLASKNSPGLVSSIRSLLKSVILLVLVEGRCTSFPLIGLLILSRNCGYIGLSLTDILELIYLSSYFSKLVWFRIRFRGILIRLKGSTIWESYVNMGVTKFDLLYLGTSSVLPRIWSSSPLTCLTLPWASLYWLILWKLNSSVPSVSLQLKLVA